MQLEVDRRFESRQLPYVIRSRIHFRIECYALVMAYLAVQACKRLFVRTPDGVQMELVPKCEKRSSRLRQPILHLFLVTSVNPVIRSSPVDSNRAIVPFQIFG